MTPEPLAPRPVATEAIPSELASLPATIPELLRLRSLRPSDPFVIGPGERLTFGDADRQSAALAARLLAGGVGKGHTHRRALREQRSLGGGVASGCPHRCPHRSPLHVRTRAGIGACNPACRRPGRRHGGDLRERLPDQRDSRGNPGSRRLRAGALTPICALLALGPRRGRTGPLVVSELPPSAPAPVVEEAQRQVTPADLLVIVTTSGTTAAPKAVVHTQGSLIRHATLLASRREMDERDRIYSPMPFSGWVVSPWWCYGRTDLGRRRGGPGAVRAGRGTGLDREGAGHPSVLLAEPSRQLAEHPRLHAPRPERRCTAARCSKLSPPESRPSSPDLAPNVLGMTETGGPHTGADHPYLPLPEHLRGTIGRSLPGMEHLVVSPRDRPAQPSGEEGELFVRGAFLMDGIYKPKRHEVFTPDGWYATGDLGWFGTDGHLRFTGRGGGMIKTGGPTCRRPRSSRRSRTSPSARCLCVRRTRRRQRRGRGRGGRPERTGAARHRPAEV